MGILKSIKHEYRNIRDNQIDYTDASNEVVRILDEVDAQGFSVLPGFLNADFCATLKNEIDRLIVTHEDILWSDKHDSDRRIFGANEVSEEINAFYEDPFITDLTSRYEKRAIKSGFTMAARMKWKPDNLGSGGGWHRDDATRKQVKAIAYLSDVDDNNGPFQYLIGSHKPIDVLKKQWGYDLKYKQNRFENEVVDEMIKDHPDRLRTFKAPAGTVIIVDTRGIHRGKPMEEGVRYALTNYYFLQQVSPHIREKMISQMLQKAK
jgi:hypothetical protein